MTIKTFVCSLVAVSILGCYAVLAEEIHFNYEKVEKTYTPQKQDGTSTTQRDISSGQASGKRQHKPFTITQESGAASSRVKPLTTTINPALQGNVLQKGTLGGSTGPTKLTLPITGGQRQ
jgi:type VI protein secretion system component Hcp